MRVLALLGFIALPLIAAAVEPSPSGATAAQSVPLKPFVAVYDVKRGGKVIGQATMTLRPAGEQQWTLLTETRGTAGMAKLLGLDVREESQFRVDGDDRLQSISYSYRQDATLKSKQRRIEFDWAAKEARVTEKDELFRYAVQPGTIDRHVVVIALGRGQSRAENLIPVASKEAVEQQQFQRHDAESVDVPAGRFPAVRFERTDKPGKGSSWYTPSLIAPLQIEQVQKDGNNIVMQLKSVN